MIEFTEIVYFINWLIVFSLIGLFGSLLLISKSSNMLVYALGKSLGLVTIGAITWLFSIFKIFSFSSLTAWTILIVGLILIVYFKKTLITQFIKNNLRLIILLESIILILFISFILIKLFSPRIEGIEKFMDVAILSNLLRHEKGIPIDTWYSTSSINYYYFGHWMIALIAKLSFVPASYAFNFGYASVLALVGGSIFAIVNFVSKKIWAGLFAVFLALFASNLYPFIKTITHNSYFFFDSGRFVETVINEYPYYSVVLGDLHAHMVGLLLSVSFLGFLVLVIKTKLEKQKLLYLSICGGLLGLMAGTNSFDVINCGVVVFIYFLWVWLLEKPNLQSSILRLVCVATPFLTLLIINAISFKPAVGGIQIALFKTPFSHILWQFGGFIILLFFGLVLILLQKNPTQYLKKLLNKQYSSVIIFIVSAFLLVLLTEILYVKDIYHFVNIPYARANTQFKIWYGSWILLAIAIPIFVTFVFKYVKSVGYKSSYVFIIILTTLMLAVGTVSGLDYIKDNKASGKQPTINGVSYLSESSPNKQKMINYVNKNISGQPIIVQAEGESYTSKSWLSSYTGTASPLGWASHEWGWRYSNEAWDEISKKKTDIKKLYESQSVEVLSQNMLNMNARYILVGPDENSLYLVNSKIIKELLGPPIIAYDDYELYGPYSLQP